MRKSILVGLIISILFCGMVSAEPTKKLLILDSQSGEPYAPARIAMLQELEAQGFVAGRNIEINRFNAQNREGLAKRILMDEADKNYDVFFINGTVANKSAYNFGYNNPKYKFVFCSITDPVGVGLVEKLNAPTNSNFTGISYPVSVETRLRFLKEALPDAKKVGFIYADMPQSHSYIGWLKDALKKPEFSDLEIKYREITFVEGDKGHLRMAKLAKRHVIELDPVVDVFLTPSDQFGTKKSFARVVSDNSKKPLMGLSKKELEEDWGAHFGVYMVQSLSGKQAGKMIVRLLKGESIKTIIPTNPSGEYGINMKRSKAIGVKYPKSVLEKAGKNIFN